jgi:ElaB/YqjD/DUF883 family membrane-anchored ribosome-binding protein
MAQKTTSRRKGADHSQTPRALVENLRDMIDEAEKMIVDTATAQVDETVAELRERLQEKLDQLKSTYQETEERVVSTAAAADQAIRHKPYQSIGIAVGVGFVLGLLLRRK